MTVVLLVIGLGALVTVLLGVAGLVRASKRSSGDVRRTAHLHARRAERQLFDVTAKAYRAMFDAVRQRKGGQP